MAVASTIRPHYMAGTADQNQVSYAYHVVLKVYRTIYGQDRNTHREYSVRRSKGFSTLFQLVVRNLASLSSSFNMKHWDCGVIHNLT